MAQRGGTRIEPALDQKWTDVEKLAWHAAVVALDTGLPVSVYGGASNGRRQLYGVTTGSSSHASYSFDEAWIFLNGLRAGVQASRRVAVVSEVSGG